MLWPERIRNLAWLLCPIESIQGWRHDRRQPWGHTTVDEFLGLVFYDPLVHTWGLARAVNQPVILDPALVERVLAVLKRPGDGRDLRQQRRGVF
jgi:hypothetical protein